MGSTMWWRNMPDGVHLVGPSGFNDDRSVALTEADASWAWAALTAERSGDDVRLTVSCCDSATIMLTLPEARELGRQIAALTDDA